MGSSLSKGWTGAQSPANRNPIEIDLYLGAGGALGAYQWGVTETLLGSQAFRDKKFVIKSVTGTSAGAGGAAIIAHGLNSGSPQMAIDGQARYWNALGEFYELCQRRTPLTWFFNPAAMLDNPMDVWLDIAHIDKTTRNPPKFLYDNLNAIITDPSKIQSGPVRCTFTTVIKKDPAGDLSDDNVEMVHHTGNEATIKAAVASGNLRKFGTKILLNGLEHWDGAYHPHGNPSLHTAMENPDRHALIITMDKRGIRQSTINQNITYGHAHNNARALEEAGKEVHVLELQHEKHWNDEIRMNIDPRSLHSLRLKGQIDGQGWLFEQFRETPEVTHTLAPAQRPALRMAAAE